MATCILKISNMDC